MERLDVELGQFTLRTRSTVVSHVAAGLSRGLEPGEQVVLHDAERGWYAGEVVDFDFGPTDTLYRIRIGVRLGVEDAHERLNGATGGEPAGRVGRQELLDLLGELRGTGRHAHRARRARGAALQDLSHLG